MLFRMLTGRCGFSKSSLPGVLDGKKLNGKLGVKIPVYFQIFDFRIVTSRSFE